MFLCFVFVFAFCVLQCDVNERGVWNVYKKQRGYISNSGLVLETSVMRIISFNL